jgi:hypothetical protein
MTAARTPEKSLSTAKTATELNMLRKPRQAQAMKALKESKNNILLSYYEVGPAPGMLRRARRRRAGWGRVETGEGS